MFYAFDNIGDDSESITDNSHRVNGKFIITIISKKMVHYIIVYIQFKRTDTSNKY